VEIENPESAEDASGGGVADEFGGFAVQSCILSVAEGLKGVGHGKREAGKGLTMDLGLSFRCEKADIDAVGGMLIAGFGEDGGETRGREEDRRG
jgi:hypothetical protein